MVLSPPRSIVRCIITMPNSAHSTPTSSSGRSPPLRSSKYPADGAPPGMKRSHGLDTVAPPAQAGRQSTASAANSTTREIAFVISGRVARRRAKQGFHLAPEPDRGRTGVDRDVAPFHRLAGGDRLEH